MKKTAKARNERPQTAGKKPGRTGWCIGIGLFIGLIFFVLFKTTSHQGSTRTTTEQTDAADQADPTRKFWKDEVFPIQEELSHSTFPVECINSRMKFVAGEIERRYGTNATLIAMGQYHPTNKMVLAQVRFENEKPVARISVPCARDIFNKLKGTSPDWHDQYEFEVAATILHELEHIIIGVRADDSEFDSLVLNEEMAWAATCTYALGPLERARHTIPPDLLSYYKAWVLCGSTTNAAWHEYIKKRYSVFDPK